MGDGEDEGRTGAVERKRVEVKRWLGRNVRWMVGRKGL